jgi:hypothetical protein
MREVCRLIWLALVGAFRSRVSLEAENTILRHPLNVLRRKSPKRPTFRMLDRLIFAGLYRLAPKVLGALAIVKPETVIKWRRAGFRSYWRWKSRRRGGRPTLATEIRKLIREMSIANPLWGAPRIHGELRKLGIDIGQTSVAKYMAKRKTRRRKAGGRSFAIMLRDLAAGFARGLSGTSRPLQSEGAGNAGRPMRPIAACAMSVGRAHTRSSGHTGITRHSPRNGLRLISCSPRRAGLSCHRRP